MQKVLEKLIHLQDVDKQLQRLEEERGDLPQKVAELDAQVEEARKRVTQQTEAKGSILSERAALDNDVELLKQQLKKYKVQLYQVKTNKEYDAITLEIETSEKSIDEKEFRSLELEETNTHLADEIKQMQQQLQTLSASLKANNEELEQNLAKTKEHQEELEKERSDIAAKLPRPILSTYDRIRNGRGGTAVAKLVGGACSECSSRVPPQHGLEIRMMNRINYCEVCGRIVVWVPEADNKVEINA